jgi:hypothetical protein
MNSFFLTIAGLGCLLALLMLFGQHRFDTGDSGGSGEDALNSAACDSSGDGGGD